MSLCACDDIWSVELHLALNYISPRITSRFELHLASLFLPLSSLFLPLSWFFLSSTTFDWRCRSLISPPLCLVFALSQTPAWAAILEQPQLEKIAMERQAACAMQAGPLINCPRPYHLQYVSVVNPALSRTLRAQLCVLIVPLVCIYMCLYVSFCRSVNYGRLCVFVCVTRSNCVS